MPLGKDWEDTPYKRYFVHVHSMEPTRTDGTLESSSLSLALTSHGRKECCISDRCSFWGFNDYAGSGRPIHPPMSTRRHLKLQNIFSIECLRHDRF